MQHYLLLYSGGEMSAPEERMAAIMAAWGAWFSSLGENLIDRGSPFQGAQGIATDGTVSAGPVGSMASGYSVIQAESFASAVEIAQRCPVLMTGTQITVYDPMPTMGM